jgi:hypothetical protein
MKDKLGHGSNGRFDPDRFRRQTIITRGFLRHYREQGDTMDKSTSDILNKASAPDACPRHPVARHGDKRSFGSDHGIAAASAAGAIAPSQGADGSSFTNPTCKPSAGQAAGESGRCRPHPARGGRRRPASRDRIAQRAGASQHGPRHGEPLGHGAQVHRHTRKATRRELRRAAPHLWSVTSKSSSRDQSHLRVGSLFILGGGGVSSWTGTWGTSRNTSRK